MVCSTLVMVWWTALAAATVILSSADLASSLRLGKPATSAGLSSSTAHRFPEDLLAKPAYKVVFDQRTISNSSAHRLLSGSSSDLDAVAAAANRRPQGPAASSQHFLMHSSPSAAHLCSLSHPSSNISNPSRLALSPSNLLAQRHRVIMSGLSLLAPLQGTCLYHTLDWFTYSLCFGESVRQFRATRETVGPGRVPTPDQSQNAYVLGRWRDQLQVVGGQVFSDSRVQAKEKVSEELDGTEVEDIAAWLGITREEAMSSSLSPSVDHRISDLLDAEDTASGTELMQIIRFSSSASSEEVEQRYLSQVWSDGTRCDINNEPRSVEVQYHCEPGLATSRIALSKETTTCNYVLIVETPLTCKEEQLRVGRDKGIESARMGEWRCRRVVDDVEGGSVEDASWNSNTSAFDWSASQEATSLTQDEDTADQEASSNKYFATGVDGDGNIIVEGIEAWEAQLLGMAAQAGAAAGQARATDGDRGVATAFGVGETLEALLANGLQGVDGEAGVLAMDFGGDFGVGEPIELRLDAEDLELLTGGRRRQRQEGEAGGPQHDNDFLGLRAEDLQGVIARALEHELNKIKSSKKMKAISLEDQDREPGSSQKNDGDEHSTLSRRLDKIAEALLSSSRKQDDVTSTTSKSQDEKDSPASPQSKDTRGRAEESNGSSDGADPALARREELIQRIAEQRAARVRDAQRKAEALIASHEAKLKARLQNADDTPPPPSGEKRTSPPISNEENIVDLSRSDDQSRKVGEKVDRPLSPPPPSPPPSRQDDYKNDFADRADQFFRLQEERRLRASRDGTKPEGKVEEEREQKQRPSEVDRRDEL